MAGRMALGVIPGAGWRASEMCSIAKEAESSGFESILAAEVNVDAMACAQAMGSATSDIKVGTWVSNIYLRHSYIIARGAALIGDVTNGRMILGLGVSHTPVNNALAVDMGSPLDNLRSYATEVASWLRGDGPATHLPQQPATHPVPIYLGAFTSATVELAAETADGVMAHLWSVSRLRQSKRWLARGQAKAPDRKAIDLALGLPIFIGDSMSEQLAIARGNVAFYTGLPYFHHLLRVSGYTEEAEKAEKGEGANSLSDTLLDDICLIGSVSRCKDRLAEYIAAGLDLPILIPPIGVDGARAVIDAMRT